MYKVNRVVLRHINACQAYIADRWISDKRLFMANSFV